MDFKRVVLMFYPGATSVEKKYINIPPKYFAIIKRIFFTTDWVTSKYYSLGIGTLTDIVAATTCTVSTKNLLFLWRKYVDNSYANCFASTYPNEVNIEVAEDFGVMVYNGAAGAVDIRVEIEYYIVKDLAEKLKIMTGM